MASSSNRAPKYKLGDKVKLNVGGPDMSINYVDNYNGFNGRYTCQWFAGKKLESGDFKEESLILVYDVRKESDS